MRWDSLFDDLESQLERELTAEELDLEREDERLRLARLGMRDRLLAAGGNAVVLHLGVGHHRVRIADVGRDWAAVDAEGPPAWSGIVPLGSVDSVGMPAVLARSTLGGGPLADGGGSGQPSLTERLGLGFVLRDLARRRRFVRIETASGMLAGTIDRVGRDHLDLAVHPPDAPRRESAVSEVRLIPLEQVQLVRLA
ncbi:hypothetical protein [Antiquaquibacter soli]|uniref:Uncharacterized protein n=1 Tax=Antiquaquibacter soli TaxID=3064523 RepID=A0ABT9BN24_9MICO|nr:hypothetical protein [Protaetiibacter sp. WY-16]MDO7881186.1 hypothetical protein [Protaetiibacter sp. WY-16]